jgi:hypothetical protein
MTRTKKVITRTIAACLGLCAGIMGSELTFGQLRAAPAQKAPAVLYSIELRNGEGDLLASPLVVGQEGQSVHLDLSQQPVAMSLDLDPRPSQAGLCLGYKLSMEDGLPHHGRVDIPYGADGGLVLLQGGGHLWLRAARAHTAAFKQLLSQRTYRPAA